jgi:hypothetical protein
MRIPGASEGETGPLRVLWNKKGSSEKTAALGVCFGCMEAEDYGAKRKIVFSK